MSTASGARFLTSPSTQDPRAPPPHPPACTSWYIEREEVDSAWKGRTLFRIRVQVVWAPMIPVRYVPIRTAIVSSPSDRSTKPIPRSVGNATSSVWPIAEGQPPSVRFRCASLVTMTPLLAIEAGPWWLVHPLEYCLFEDHRQCGVLSFGRRLPAPIDQYGNSP